MRVLTICQPYATLIMQGHKRVENRDWPTRHRGQMFIHAGKSRAWMGAGDDATAMPFGAILGFVTLVDCVHISKVHESEHRWLPEHLHTIGPWCWVLSAPHQFVEPIPCAGKLGLWRVGLDVVPSGFDPKSTVGAEQ
jgi:activating signal cointegrator 1